jgi:hypothetical protein
MQCIVKLGSFFWGGERFLTADVSCDFFNSRKRGS